MRKLLILLLAALLILPLVSGAPPPKTIVTTDKGYIIEFIDTTPIKMNENYTFNIHVSNSSNGIPIHDDLANCGLHLYDTNGNHIFENNSLEHVGMDWEMEVTGDNFTTPGLYGGFYWCNISSIAGTRDFYFLVTKTGEEIYDSTAILQGFIFLALVGLCFLLMFMSYQTNEAGIKLFFVIMGFLTSMLVIGGMWLSLDATAYPNNMDKILEGAFFVFSIILTIIIFYILINQTRRSIELMRAKRGFVEDDNPAYF